jgi:hypothetical protein
MLTNIKNLYGYRLHPIFSEDEIGQIEDFYFDDKEWMVRYAVIDTGEWISGRSVLISPSSFAGPPHWDTATLPVYLSREEIEHAPSIDTHLPISRQKELELAAHYHWPAYWALAGNDMRYEKEMMGSELQNSLSEEDSRLRGMNSIFSYSAWSENKEIGCVVDFLCDAVAWSIPFIVIDIPDEPENKSVLIATSWIERIEWERAGVFLSVDICSVLKAPEYNVAGPVSRIFEEQLYDYYKMP